MTRFLPASSFRNIELYRLLPFRFMRRSDSEVFLANEVGQYCYLSNSDFDRFIQRSLPATAGSYKELKTKHFLTDSATILPIELLAVKYRTKRSFLEGFVKLHLFVVTLRCDHACRYCAAASVPATQSGFDMDERTASHSVDIMLSCPSSHLKVEFQGGEPLLNFRTVKFIHQYAENRKSADRKIEYVICSNLASLDDAILGYLCTNKFYVSTSLDGPRFLHDANRRLSGASSHERTEAGIRTLMTSLGQDRISALMTTTELTLSHPREIIDEYVRLGLTSIFLRPIRPYGRARSGELSYDTERFVTFYREALCYIIDLNRRGTKIIEGFAQILLTKIVTPFATGFVDLQSPAGAGIGFVAYNYDGDVYASDEGRMLAQAGDKTFRMGNVQSNSYDEIFAGSTARALVESSCVEVLPGCAECAFQVYCGADPIHHYVTQADLIGHRPTSDFCRKHMAIIRFLLDLLRDGDSFTKELLVSWTTPPAQET